MRWPSRDVERAAKCTGATFSLTGDDGAEFFEGVDAFKYLLRVLNWAENDWLVVLRNIQRARQVWGRLEVSDAGGCGSDHIGLVL